jgi:hypothetical protein
MRGVMPDQNIMRATDNYNKRHLALFVLLVLILVLSGCGTMMVLLGDNIRYSISGKVQDSSISDAKGISGVKVSLECPGTENSIYQNRKGTTDQDGYYQLSGYWELKGCKISFDQEGYITKTIQIDRNHLIKSEGLSRTYVVNARLE